MHDNPERVELDLAVDGRCKKIILPFYLALKRGQKKAVTVAVKSETVHNGQDGERPFPLRLRESGNRYICERDFVSGYD